MQQSDFVQILVTAESEENQSFDWHTCLRMHEQVRLVAEAWASAYGVPANAVGLDENDSGQELDLQLTPVDLGWAAGGLVTLNAFPTEEQLMEGEEVVPPPMPMPAVAKAAPKTATKQEGRDPSRRCTGSRGHGSATAGANRQQNAQPKQQPRSAPQPQQQTQKQDKVYTRPAGHGDAAPKVDALGTNKSTRTGITGPVIWDQANPKRPGNSAYERYERYKRAKTVEEALGMGAASGDITHDFKKGYVKHQ